MSVTGTSVWIWAFKNWQDCISGTMSDCQRSRKIKQNITFWRSRDGRGLQRREFFKTKCLQRCGELPVEGIEIFASLAESVFNTTPNDVALYISHPLRSLRQPPALRRPRGHGKLFSYDRRHTKTSLDVQIKVKLLFSDEFHRPDSERYFCTFNKLFPVPEGDPGGSNHTSHAGIKATLFFFISPPSSPSFFLPFYVIMNFSWTKKIQKQASHLWA